MRIFILACKPLRLPQKLLRCIMTRRPVTHDDSLRAGCYIESRHFVITTPWSSYVRP